MSVQERTRSATERIHDFSELFDRAVAACAESQRIVGLSARTMRYIFTILRSALSDAVKHGRPSINPH